MLWECGECCELTEAARRPDLCPRCESPEPDFTPVSDTPSSSWAAALKDTWFYGSGNDEQGADGRDAWLYRGFELDRFAAAER